MKRLMAVLGLSALAAAAQASEVLRELSWQSLKARGAVRAGEVRPADGSARFGYLELKNPESAPHTITLFELDTPGITQTRYAIVGEVRYEAVEGTGYLEMWSTIPQKGSFFTRTMAPSGPMQSLSGSSPWREFTLPFDATGASAPVQKLTVNVALPGRGTVYLGPLRLIQFAADEDHMAAAGAWWGPRTAGLVGGITGSFLGCVGAAIGLLASRGSARRLVLGLARGLLVLGVIALVLGIVALLRAQPYEVCYPLLLEGVICVTLPAWLIPVLRRRYEELELRKMAARDLSARHA